MSAADFHVTHSWRQRTVDLSAYPAAAAWRAAQAFAREGARVLLPSTEPIERARRFDALARERGLDDLIVQEAARPRGMIAIGNAAIVEAGGTAERPEPSAPVPDGPHVSLVGCGPGDPRLLTAAAMHAIAHADVVFLDRLGIALNATDLAPGALIIDVGKTPGRHKLAQERINEEMAVQARAGARVVRIKGGDLFIFGRGGEEWHYLAALGIPVEVVPGITSALSVPAHAGISATYRNVTRAVTILSGHQPFNDVELAALVALRTTIIILMGVGTFPSTVSGLLRAGLPPSTGVALLERGYTDTERHTFTTLERARKDAVERGVRNPAILMIGDVVDYRLDLQALTLPTQTVARAER